MNLIVKKLKSWKTFFKKREYYCTNIRDPFYEIARKYLPEDGSKILADIGSGSGSFAEYIATDKKFGKIFLLDANSSTVEDLKTGFANVKLYKAPEKLPFKDNTVNYIHCSHLFEHLYSQEVYLFLKEIDRVLEKGGILIVSTPLLWSGFYDNLTHIRIYPPQVFINYLSLSQSERSQEIISTDYMVKELVYRYTTESFEHWGSRYEIIDLLTKLLTKIMKILKIRKYLINGYTLVFKKGPDD